MISMQLNVTCKALCSVLSFRHQLTSSHRKTVHLLSHGVTPGTITASTVLSKENVALVLVKLAIADSA